MAEYWDLRTESVMDLQMAEDWVDRLVLMMAEYLGLTKDHYLVMWMVSH